MSPDGCREGNRVDVEANLHRRSERMADASARQRDGATFHVWPPEAQAVPLNRHQAEATDAVVCYVPTLLYVSNHTNTSSDPSSTTPITRNTRELEMSMRRRSKGVYALQHDL